MKRVLLDHCVPRPFGRALPGRVETSAQCGWSELRNGNLLTVAERAGFDVLITSDKNLRYQQNPTGRRIAIIELPLNRLNSLHQYQHEVSAALQNIQPGEYVRIPLSKS